MDVESDAEVGVAERAARVVWAAGDDEAARRAHLLAARRRGLLQAAVGFSLAALLASCFGRMPGSIAAGVAGLVFLLSLLSPLRGLAAVEWAVARVAAWAGTGIAWLLITPLYYLLLTPLAWSLRARGRLRLRRRPDSGLTSYWNVPSGRGESPESYERQF